MIISTNERDFPLHHDLMVLSIHSFDVSLSSVQRMFCSVEIIIEGATIPKMIVCSNV